MKSVKSLSKICVCLIICLLSISVVYSVSVEDIKVPNTYSKVDEGYYTSISDKNVHVYIGKFEDNDLLFVNSDDGTYGVSMLDDKIYIYLDTLLVSSGVQEVVNLDEGKYMISVYNDDIVADPDSNYDVSLMNGYHQLKDINNLNGLTPVEA